jgi:hypothetical protein
MKKERELGIRDVAEVEKVEEGVFRNTGFVSTNSEASINAGFVSTNPETRGPKILRSFFDAA